MTHTRRQARRRSLRLKGYDYARPGAYFVTIVTWNRLCLFGEVVEGEMRLNAHGRIVLAAWEDLPNHYPAVDLDAFETMPNHVHGIIVLIDNDIPASVGAGLKPAPTKKHGLPEIVRAFKTFSARRINEQRRKPGTPVWQRNYYDHIIRNERALDRIRRYITDNPLRWALDRENPANLTLASNPRPPEDEPWRV